MRLPKTYIHVHFQAFPPSSYCLPYACKLSKTGLWERLATATFWGVDVCYGTSVQTILLWKCLLHRLEIHLSACVFHLGMQSFGLIGHFSVSIWYLFATFYICICYMQCEVVVYVYEQSWWVWVCMRLDYGWGYLPSMD